MKRRIISSILVIVMLVVMLASCGYSYANDKNLAGHAPFTAEEMEIINKAIAEIVIEDGEFTRDPATRAQKVLENINSQFAAVADTNDKKKEGTPNALRDIVYYCFYYSAEIDGETYYFATSSMKDSSASKAQLGRGEYDDEVVEAIVEVLSTLDFTDKTYAAITTSAVAGEDGNSADVLAKAGDLAFVTYTYTYVETVDGVEKEQTGKFTSTPIVIEAVAEGETATTLAQFLCGKKNAVTLSGDDKTFKATVDGKEITYSGIKIDWIADGEAATDFEIEITEEKTANSTWTPSGKSASKTLKIGTKLTYHLYPVYYVPVSEFTAKNLIDLVLAKDITYDKIIQTLFGTDYVGLDENDEEDKEKIEELKTKVEAYKQTAEDGTVTTLEQFVEKIAKLQGEVAAKKTALDNAKTAVDTAKASYEKAEKVITDKEAKGETATEAEIATRDSAKNTYDEKVKAQEEAQTAYDTAVTSKNEAIDTMLGLGDMDAALAKGFRVLTYNSLQTAYNNEIKTKLATEIYFFLNKHIKVNTLPKDAVKDTYDQLINNHKSAFYTGDDDSDKESNYKEFNGSFKSYLKDKMKAGTYEAALDAVWAEAEEINEPILRIYRAAEAYGVLVSDKAFEEYVDSEYSKAQYESLCDYYGKNSVRHAYQFDQLLNYWLEELDPTEAEADADGYVFITPNYKNISNDFADRFGTPASEAEEETETEND